MKTYIQGNLFLGLTLLVGLSAGCSSSYSPFSRGGSFGFEIGGPPGLTEDGNEVPTTSTTPDDPPTDNSTPPPICDPLGTGVTGSSTHGLLATLTYMDPPPSGSFNLADFVPGMPDVLQVLNPVYLNSLSKKTSYFEDGFSDSDGNELKKENGDLLMEYFSLFTAAQIQLGASDPEGEYQFALIADDGAIMNVQRNGSTNWERWVNNDGTHPNKVVCASQTISMHQGDKLPAEIGWFQGPQYRISLMLFWRTGSDLDIDEPECGQTVGDEYFFTNGAGQPPVATTAYTDFLSRGWKLLSASNFLLPENSSSNPCQ